MSTETTVSCALCKQDVEGALHDHLRKTHQMTPVEYHAQFPTAPLAAPAVLAVYEESYRRTPVAPPQDLKVHFGKTLFPFNAHVPGSACLPMPPYYAIPTHGDLARDVQHVMVALWAGRSIYVHGMPGTGKDALFHAFSAITRTPAIIRQVVPGSDIEGWFFARAFNATGTFWEEGDVLRALRDGYLCEDGTRVPYMVLITDFDRADRSQAEHLRLITDSISRRISGPQGITYPVMPGTRIIATANTAGSGDERGRCVSATPLDASILDRFERKFLFHYMDWKDEEPIVKAKFPRLTAADPKIMDTMGKVVSAVRKAILTGDLYAELSHRGVCSILGHAEDMLMLADTDKIPPTFLSKAFRVWLDGLPDTDTRETAIKIIDPYVPHGMLKHGNTDHIESELGSI